MKILIGVFGVVAIALAIGMAQNSDSKSPTGRVPSTQSAVFSLTVQKLASKFLCACGSCDVPELADCTCPTAIEEKQFIDRELKRGAPENEVLVLLNDRYGNMKPRFASLLGTGFDQSNSPADVASPIDLAPSAGVAPPAELAAPSVRAESTNSNLATTADADPIASKFICACGQCKDHVLKDCDCDHPRGAVEMKAFIKYKISQKAHTPEAIVQAVAYEYGHLIKK